MEIVFGLVWLGLVIIPLPATFLVWKKTQFHLIIKILFSLIFLSIFYMVASFMYSITQRGFPFPAMP